MNDSLPESPDQSTEKTPPQGSYHTFLAAGAAAAVLILVLILVFRGSEDSDFLGRDALVTLIRKAQHLEDAQFEAVEIRGDEIGDWLLTKGFDGVHIPKSLAGMKIRARTTMKSDTSSIAVFTLEGNTRHAVVFPFSSTTMDLPEDGTWRIFDLPATRESSPITMAVTADKNIGFAIFTKETPHELKNWLQENERSGH